jgi:hypothetical protein
MLMSGCWILSDAPIRASHRDDMAVSGSFYEKNTPRFDLSA